MELILKAVHLFLIAICLIDACTNPTVNLKQGRLIGKRVNFKAKELRFQRFIDAYLSIPYAEAPVGPLRFQPPVPKEWKGELNVTQHGNACLQSDLLGRRLIYFELAGRPIGEDCLSLDVFVPVPTPRKAAVMLWIHGGSYHTGAGTPNGAEPYPIVALGDVIVVTVNYRLGPLGFLTTGDDVIPGNMGLLDQVEAMKWVQTNIAAFGGDPDKVTIFGQSIGASSVSLHTLSPLSRGLFSRAIMQSGVAISDFASNDDTENYAKRAFAFGQFAGCNNTVDTEQLLECLVNVPADIFYAVDRNIPGSIPDDSAITPFAPAVDGNFLPEPPSALVEKQSFNRTIDLMVGFNADEGMIVPFNIFTTAIEKPHMDANLYETLLASIKRPLWHPLQRSVVDVFYLDDSLIANPLANYLDTYVKISTDYFFACPTDAYLRAASEAAEVGETYLYYLNHHPSTSFANKSWTGTNNMDDLVFFGLHFIPDNGISLTDEEIDMTMKMIRYWTNFAQTGNPNIASVEEKLTPAANINEWPRFTIHDPAYKELSPAMNNGRHLRARECTLWNDLIPKMERYDMENC